MHAWLGSDLGRGLGLEDQMHAVELGVAHECVHLAHGTLEARQRPDLPGAEIINHPPVEGAGECVALERAGAKVVGRADDQRWLGVCEPIVLEDVRRARTRL
jgi:hypothetical protein